MLCCEFSSRNSVEAGKPVLRENWAYVNTPLSVLRNVETCLSKVSATF